MYLSFMIVANFWWPRIFDLSGASGTVTAATLKLYAHVADSGGNINNGHGFYVVGHTYGGALNSAADDINPTNNTTGDWTSTSVPTYASETIVNGVSAGDLISVTLNSTAISAINTAVGSGDFDIGIIGNHDYKDDFTISPTPVDGFGYNGVQISTVDHATSAYRPVLSLTTAAPAEITIPSLGINSGQVNLKGGIVRIK